MSNDEYDEGMKVGFMVVLMNFFCKWGEIFGVDFCMENLFFFLKGL